VHAADGTKHGTAKQRASVASAVTCKFCAARLVAIGALTTESMSPAMPAASRDYALAYGSVTADDALASIEARAAEAAAVLAAKPKRQRRKATQS
jgi:hypothetical protein